MTTKPLFRRLTQLAQQKEQLLASIACLSPERQTFRSTPAEWTLWQIVDHLVRTEDAIMEQTLANLPDGHEVGAGDRIRGFLLEMLFRSPARVKVPAKASNVLPGPEPNPDLLREEWNAARVRMQAAIGSFPAAALQRGVFKHPVSGWMTITQTMRFLSSHIVHHRHQLARQEKAFATAQARQVTPA